MIEILFTVRRGLRVLWTGVKYAVPVLIGYVLAPRRAIASPERFRLLAEELGLTYLKLGQFLATRYDILPTEVCRELTKLFDSVPAMPLPAVRAVVETELGRPLEDLFTSFVDTPIAAGSLAQVHEARGLGGERLAVKVQRAGIQRVLEADMRILRLLARAADLLVIRGVVSVRSVLDDFFVWTGRELDFAVEGRTADRLRACAAPDEVLPRVYWSLSTTRVLTMEMLDGLNLSQIHALLERGGEPLLQSSLPGLRLREALHTFALVYLRQLFVTGFFHGDPHPGNILLRADNSVAFVDCGISGELRLADRRVLLGYYQNLAKGDIAKSVRYYARLTEPADDADMPGFERDVEVILRRWYWASHDPGATLVELHWGRYVNEIVAAARVHGLKLRSDYLMWARAIGMLNTNLLMFSVDFLAELRLFFEQMHQELLEQAFGREQVLRWARSVSALSTDGTRQIATLASGGRRVPVSVVQRPSRALLRAAHARHVVLAVAVLGLSAAGLVVAVPALDPAFRIGLGIVATGFLTWPIVRMGRA